jgi:hypothetical protein
MTVRRRRWGAPIVAPVLAVAVALAGCALGERPSFDQAPTDVGTTTGDASIDAVLTRLDNAGQAVFTAGYTATLVFNNQTTAARATQSSPARRAVQIGEITFVTDETGGRTCVDGGCTPTIDAAAVSNTGLTPEFFFGDVAKRLRRAAQSKIGPSVPSTKFVAGADATCVAIPVTGGAVQACVFIDGVVAEFIGGDVVVSADSYVAAPDDAMFGLAVSGP